MLSIREEETLSSWRPRAQPFIDGEWARGATCAIRTVLVRGHPDHGRASADTCLSLGAHLRLRPTASEMTDGRR
ncbi:MAG TPA: hypothetical protein DCS84_09695 [Microbacterium sp.]|nr:hypothetical protein [Microbacterium sp.]